MFISDCSVCLLADMVSLEILLLSGGALVLLVGGTFFAVAAFVAGLIKRRKLKNDSQDVGESTADGTDLP